MDLISLLRGLLGLVVLIGIALLFSSNRKAINWKVVGFGLACQIILAIGILKVSFIQFGFEIVGKGFVKIIDWTREGTTFLFGSFMDVSSYGFIFALQVLPTIIFFSALTSVLFYLGVIQKVVYGLAWVFTKLLNVSGAESLSVAGNIFLGQTEAPLLIKEYLSSMNRSEILLVMLGGMATVAGGVLSAYIAFLGGDDPSQRVLFAKHLLAASIMAAPGAIVVSKILLPQTESINSTIEVSKQQTGSNLLDSISKGTTEGLKLAVINYGLLKLGDLFGLNEIIKSATSGQYAVLSLQYILGNIFAPLMWIIGVDSQDITLVGQLLGEKITVSEFVGYASLAEMKTAGAFASQKSIIMSTYILCGFANVASIGIQIGGIGSLAPSQRKTLSELGVKALIGGTIASLFSATIVGAIS